MSQANNAALSDNVVVFPRPFQGSSPPSVEALKMQKDEANEAAIILATEDLMNHFYEGYLSMGYNNDTPEKQKDMYNLMETIRACLCRQYDMKHPYHDLAETCFIEEEDRVYFRKVNFSVSIPDEAFENNEGC